MAKADEELAYAERALAQNAIRIAKQRNMIATMTPVGGMETNMALRVLHSLTDAQATLQRLRAILVNEVEHPIRR